METLTKNSLHTVTIEDYGSTAFGVCRIDGRAVFVPGTIVGERWRIRIVKVGASVNYGRGEELLLPSPERLEPDCAYYPACGGCDTRHMSYREECRFKLERVNADLRRIGKQSLCAEEIVSAEDILRYRNKGIVEFAPKDGKSACGFYRPRTHDLIAVDSCLLQSELTDRVSQALSAFLDRNGLLPYEESSGKGTVRHLFCRTTSHGEAVICVCSAKGFGSLTSSLVEALRSSCPEATGIVLNINRSKGNVVLAGDLYTLWGSDELHEDLCGFTFSVSPRSFFQINHAQAEKLYELACRYAGSGRLALDLYCGTGTIGICLTRSFERVIGAEVVPDAVENARANAERNGIKNIEFFCGDAGKTAAELQERDLQPDVVVVDPPRKGMDPETIRTVCSLSPGRVVYVSCDPATLSRDLLLFNELGYSLRKVTAVDMFPRTRHVETVCLLYHQMKDFISLSYEPKDADYLKQLK